MHPIYPNILWQELKDANIDFQDCNSLGEVWKSGGERIQGLPEVQAVIQAHLNREYQVDSFGRPIPTEQVFQLPLVAPSITVESVYIQSPIPKTDPDKALAEALAEAAKTGKKDLSLIVVSLLHYIDKKVKK